MVAWIIFAVVVFVILIFFISTFNTLVRAKNNAVETFSSVDVHLKLRFDLIPNLVEVVKGFEKHEKTIFEQATKLRVEAQKATDEKQKIEIANKAVPFIEKIFALGENYPKLKSSEVFLKLTQEMVEVEDKISASRRFYNSAIKNYNNLVMTFPVNITAKLFGFKKKKSFEIVSTERLPVVKTRKK